MSGGSNKIKTKFACILEADESTRMRMGNSIPHNHEDHIAGKGDNSLQHYNLVHKFIPMPQAVRVPAAKAAGDKEWEKLEKISAWNLTKVRSQKEVIDEARTSGAKFHFASLMDIQGVSFDWGVMLTKAPIKGNRAWEAKFLFHAPVSLDWGYPRCALFLTFLGSG